MFIWTVNDRIQHLDWLLSLSSPMEMYLANSRLLQVCFHRSVGPPIVNSPIPAIIVSCCLVSYGKVCQPQTAIAFYQDALLLEKFSCTFDLEWKFIGSLLEVYLWEFHYISLWPTFMVPMTHSYSIVRKPTEEENFQIFKIKC